MKDRLDTERLIFSPLAPEDVDAHCAMMTDPGAARFLTIDGLPQDRPAAWRGFAAMLGHWSIRGFGFFAVIEKSTGEWVGRVGPWLPAGWPGLECGWAIVPSRRGLGYAPEAAAAAIDWIFTQRPDLDRIISLIHPDNAASRAVATKLGERRTEERFAFENLTLDVWAIDRRVWTAKRPPA